MKKGWNKYLILGIAIVVINLFVTFLLFKFASTIFDSIEASKEIMKWRETGEYPFPKWLLYLIPRLGIWPISAEIAYEALQAVVWGCNGYLLRRYFLSMKPVKWVWVPIVIHLIGWDPIQVLIGSTSFYLIARNKKYVTEKL